MSERGCREAVRRYRAREREDLLDREMALDVLHEALAGFEEKLATCSAIIHREAHPLVRIGAIKAALTVEQARVKLLMELGVVPRDLGSIAVERDLAETAERMVDVLDRRGVSEDIQREVLEAVEARPGAAQSAC